MGLLEPWSFDDVTVVELGDWAVPVPKLVISKAELLI